MLLHCKKGYVILKNSEKIQIKWRYIMKIAVAGIGYVGLSKIGRAHV